MGICNIWFILLDGEKCFYLQCLCSKTTVIIIKRIIFILILRCKQRYILPVKKRGITETNITINCYHIKNKSTIHSLSRFKLMLWIK